VIGGFIEGSTTPACAVNEQYIPIGYHSTPITPTIGPTLSKPDDSSETFLTYLIVTALSLIAGVVAIALFFYSKQMRDK